MAFSVANCSRTVSRVAPMHEKCEAALTPFGQNIAHGIESAFLGGATGTKRHRAKLGLQGIQLLAHRCAAFQRPPTFWVEKIQD
jgi:hypothetical protein